jgi:hypothetical protein
VREVLHSREMLAELLLPVSVIIMGAGKSSRGALRLVVYLVLRASML